MRTLDARLTAAALPYPQLADEIGRTLADARVGRLQALERATARLPGDGTFLLMGAADERLAIAKVGSVHPGNPARGLPTILASVLVTDATTGEPRALVDGATVTVRRTAALSLHAAQRLGARTGTVYLVGAGAQALGHVEALHAGIGVGRLLVRSRTRGRAAALVAHARSLGIDARLAVEEGAAATDELAASDLIVTTTDSREPVLPAELAERLRPTSTIVAVGAFRPDMAEVPPAVVAVCDVVVDSLEGARAEAGDLLQAAAAGAWGWERATPLAEVAADHQRAGRPVLFKSVGHALWDLAAARLLEPG
ncbi:MAG: delta(1)-pyrroline-2-carboxylate reductase family protein [Deinococcales bacterium]|nr:delta(1)-pyrroline-2-carboxylate reductase family protein [Deinococcales bacterium]